MGLVEGYIRNTKGTMLPATIQLVLSETGEPITVPPFKTSNGNYSAWTEHDPNKVAVKFSMNGYRTQIVPMTQLYQSPDITLIQDNTIPWPVVGAVIAAVVIYQNQQRRKGKQVGLLGAGDILPIFLLVGGIIGFDIIKRILETIGLWNSKESKELDEAAQDSNSFWNPQFWATKPPNVPYTRPITEGTAMMYAERMYNAFGAFNDDEEEVIGVFRALPSRAAASFVSWAFQKKYGSDLLKFLRGGNWPQDRLSDDDVYEIQRYVSTLPKY